MLEQHLREECLYQVVECQKCQLKFVRPEIEKHDCIQQLIRSYKEMEQRVMGKKEIIITMKEENTRLKEQIRDRDKRINELEIQMQSEQIGNLAGINNGQAVIEE